MRRIVGLVVLALIVVLGLAPYGFGVRTEQTLSTLVQLAAHVRDIPVHTTQYARGWFGSTAETFLTLPPEVAALVRPYLPSPPASSATPVGLTMAHRIRHGPFPIAGRPGSIISLLPVQTIIASSLTPGVLSASGSAVPAAGLPVLQVYTTVSLYGTGQSRVVMPAWHYPPGAPTEARLVWDGMHGDLTVGAHGRQITGALQAPGLRWSGEGGGFALRDVVTRSTVSTGQQQPTHSDTVVRLGAVEATHRTEAQATWAITDGEVRASTTATGAMLQAVAEVQLDTLRLAEVLAGPGTAHLEVHRLHFPALTSLLREVMELWQDEPDFSALWLRLQWSGDLARQLAGLAGSQPEIALTRMRLQTTDGVVQATLRLRLDGNRLLVPGYFPQLGQAIDAAIDGEAPASWVRAVVIAQVRQAMRARSQLAARTPTTVLNTLAATITDLQLRRLVAQKYLLLDGNMYRSQARYIRGRLLVNGKPLDLAALVQ